MKKIQKPVTQHRIFHILNRNTVPKKKFSFAEVFSAFNKVNYDSTSDREKVVYSRFFKECDEKDLDDLMALFEVTKDNLKSIYSSLGEFDTQWDKIFNIKTRSQKNKYRTHARVGLDIILKNKRKTA